MSNIEVGEYIRTDKGIISKINSGVDIDMIEFENAIIGNIVTHSKNIIDLIEVGDYVNGCEVIMTYCYDENGNDKDRLGITETDMDYAWYTDLQDINIYSIVTKEQFKEMEYKVNE